MPNRPRPIRLALAALGLAAAALSGCAASGGNAVLTLAPTEFDLVLPDTVTVLPEFSGRTEITFAAPAGVEPPIVPAAYAANEMAGAEIAAGSPELDRLIAKYAALYEVPEALVRRVVKRESTFNPKAYNRGHWGLMQIKHATARGMGYKGPANGLLDAETNLKYAVKYLRGAYLVADGNFDVADRLYQSGYYYHAKRKGLLDETGLGKDRVRRRAKG